MKPFLDTKILLCVFVCLFSLMACKPQYPSRDAALPIYPTISSDGKLVVVLDHSGEENPRLRIKWLDRDEPWLEVPGPKYANSIRFGLTGYGLLITHAKPGPAGASQLSRWDVSNPAKPSEILYEGTRVIFPIEVKPGQVLVRMCPQPPSENACKHGIGIMQALIEDSTVTLLPETESLLYDQPNVVEGGFFWLEDEYFSKKRGDPKRREITAFALPKGKVPQFELSRFDETSTNLSCDRKANRCLLHYITNQGQKSNYVYGFKIFSGSSTCILSNIKGWQDKFSITPDGSAAVMSHSRIFEEPRHLVVLRFKSGQCEPASVQHIPFNKETSK